MEEQVTVEKERNEHRQAPNLQFVTIQTDLEIWI
jgi:hypothetical protein